jgi:hypothetical protein
VPTLFDEPDLVQANGIMLAAFKNACARWTTSPTTICRCRFPSTYNDLDLELKLVTAYYNRMQDERAPDYIQDRFRQYIDLVVNAIKQKNGGDAAPNAGVNAPMPGAPPPGPPMPPMPGGLPPMPQGPVPPPTMVGAPPPGMMPPPQ